MNRMKSLMKLWPLALTLILLAITALADVSLPGSLSVIEAEAFRNDTSLRGTLYLPRGLKSIGARAFEGCSGLSGSFTLPETVESIGSRAFAGCSGLSGELYIPESVTYLAPDAFEGTGLKLVFDNGEDKPGTGDTVVTMTDLPEGLEYEMTPSGCVITGYTGKASAVMNIPSTINGVPVVAIGDRAFQDCSELTGRISIPSTVTRIGASAFAGCTSVSGTLNIPSSVRSIGSFAFYECLSLSGSLRIPSSVSSIGESAFAFCEGMTGSLSLPSNVTIGARCFQGSGFTGSLVIPSTMILGANAFTGTKLSITWATPTFSYEQNGSVVTITGWNGPVNAGLTIPSQLGGGLVSGIAAEAFADIGLQGRVVIPSSVVYIGESAFRSNPGITGLSLSEGLMTISAYAFADCTGLSGAITLPATVTNVDPTAFSGTRVTVSLAPAR